MNTDPEAKMLAAAFEERLVSIRKRISAKQVHKAKQSNAIDPINSKGKGTPNELTHPSRPYQIPHDLPPTTQPSPADPPALTHPSPFQSSADETQNPQPFISSTIDALDLAIPNNPLHFIRTHGGRIGKLNAKKNKRNGPNLDQIWEESWNQFINRKKPREPKCLYGSRRKLDQRGDDRMRGVCWFHDWNPGRERDDCRRERGRRMG